eukprot:c40761_g1_i1 orf=119-304(+)
MYLDSLAALSVTTVVFSSILLGWSPSCHHSFLFSNSLEPVSRLCFVTPVTSYRQQTHKEPR